MLLYGSVIVILFGGACFYAMSRTDDENVRRLLGFVGLGLVVLGTIGSAARSVLRLINRFGGE